MNNYTLHTRIGWRETYQALTETFKKWGVDNWYVNQPKGVRNPNTDQSDEDRTVVVTYQLRGKDVRLSMGKQATARDNLRVLYLALEDMRMQEVRGVAEVFESAYLQLAAPVLAKDPYEVLNLYRGAPLSVCEAMYKELVKQNHPDVGGSPEKMKELSEAITAIRGEQK